MTRRKVQPLLAAVRAVGLTAPHIAQTCGVARGTVYAWAEGRARIPERHVPTLAEALDVSEDTVRAMGLDPVEPPLRGIARAKGWQNDALALLLDVSPYVMRTAMTGQRRLPARAHAQLEEVLGVPAALLLNAELDVLDAELEATLDADEVSP